MKYRVYRSAFLPSTCLISLLGVDFEDIVERWGKSVGTEMVD